MTDKPSLHEQEIARRRDDIVRRMIATPPTPHKPKAGREPKPAPAKKD